MIVTNHGEPSNEDENYSERNHNPKVSQIILTRKLHHERRGKPSPLAIMVNRLLMDKL